MTWDPIWEHIYKTREWGRYPPEELIRFISRHFYAAPNRSNVSILELGCGTGANIWFLAREGFDAHGVDASRTAIDLAASRLREERVAGTLTVGDVSSLTSLYHNLRFDAVLDVTCLQHNDLRSSEAILAEVSAVLKPAGRLFSMVVARGSHGDETGREVEPGTYVDIEEGPACGMGLCRFLSRKELEYLFRGFCDVQIGHSTRSLDGDGRWWKHWLIDGVKCV